MPGPVQITRAQYINIDTDFGYDALGGVGRLGEHSLEVLTAGVRQTDRVPGPPQTLGRWFSRLLDMLTPASWRAQGKFWRGLEDFSAQTGRVLGHLCNAGRQELSEAERGDALASALKELASLRSTAEPMTKRGTDYIGLLQTRVRRNVAILRDENPVLLQELLSLKDGTLLDDAVAGLDPDIQGDMAEDLRLIRDTLRAEAEEDREAGAVNTAEDVHDAAEEQAEPPYQSRFSAASLRAFFLENFTFKGHAQRALRERQATLDRFTGEAKELLQATLAEVDSLLRNEASTDTGSFSQVQRQVDEKMGQAIRCAIDDVCKLALQYMDRRGSVGQEGQDFQRIDADFVRRELDAIANSISSGTELSRVRDMPGSGSELPADPFREGVQKARQQIQDISLLYGELTEGLTELERRSSRLRCCLLLQELAGLNALQSVRPQDFGEACDRLIDALRSPVHGNSVEGPLLLLEAWIMDEAVPQPLRARFTESLPELRRCLSPDPLSPSFRPEAASVARAECMRLEQLRAIHQTIGDAGALLQRAKLPQAARLIAQGFQVSRLALQVYGSAASDVRQRQMGLVKVAASLSQFMTNLTLARMQLANPTVRSAQPKAEGLDREGAQEGLDLLQRSVTLLTAGLEEGKGGAVVRAAMNNGRELMENGEEAALACGRLLANKAHKEIAVAKQLAVCAESGLDAPEATLRHMMEGLRWEKGKHSEARAAIQSFLDALRPVREGRNQTKLLQALSDKIKHDIIVHDIYMGLEGNIHMLINTDRQTILGESKEIQGTYWITLPSPEQVLQHKVSTGVTRLDRMFSVEENRTDFYPQLYRALLSDLSERN